MSEFTPGVFGVAPGVDFPKALLDGLAQRLHHPEEWARTEIYVNTRRMRRRLIELFQQGPARLLPRIRLVNDLSHIAALAGLPDPVPPLRRRLELTQLIARLLESQPDLAPKSALFDLADSLAALMDEMHSEGVAPEVLHDLDVSHLSAHWHRARQFLEIVAQYFGEDAKARPDREAYTRLATEYQIAAWRDAPPDHPIIIAGSTGSRGATALLMQAVAKLPQGAVVLPGFDFDTPASVWGALDDALTAEDHPQFRFARLLDVLSLDPSETRHWHKVEPPCAGRNKLVSLALRPAPVTDQWLTDGRDLGALEPHCADITLIEAASPRAEANAIALCLRDAAERGVPAALITPDRVLTRQVTAALDRWGIEPDDSAGVPLPLSAPGRFLRHIAALMGQRLTIEALLTLLKHPLTSTGVGRGDHLRWTRELELHLRRKGPAFPCGDDLRDWAAMQADTGCEAWAAWLAGVLDPLPQVATRALTSLLELHLAAADVLAAGPNGDNSRALWEKPAGIAARTACDTLIAEAEHGGDITPAEYGDVFRAVLAREEVHDPLSPHPTVMIWGTLEARVQGADLVILAGLNEGSWPQIPAPDPWLNRDMRKRAGLLLPERRIGLSAHDFQQAIAAPKVVLTRAIRNAESETVPSRWLNRLTNLLAGLPDQGGKQALKDMQGRGQHWLNMAAQIETPLAPTAPTPRPAPSPPIAARPNKLSVTRIQKLIRDPYAIYAERILGLRPLDPLRAEPDAAKRGTVLHLVMERFIAQGVAPDPAQARADLMRIGGEILDDNIPWPTARRLWRARLARVADWFIEGETHRITEGTVAALEKKGSITLQNGFELSAEADRIDQLLSGGLVVFDYKTGQVPTPDQMDKFDKQLILEAAIADRGGFAGLRGSVALVAHIGLGSTPKLQSVRLEPGETDTALGKLTGLIDSFHDRSLGYQARRALVDTNDTTDFDHLSRFGEWDESDDALTMEVST